MTAPTTPPAGGNSPAMRVPPVRFADPVKNAAYWARVDAIVAKAPPLSVEQCAVIRLAFSSVTRTEVAA